MSGSRELLVHPVYRIHALQKAGFLHITGRFFVHLLGNPHGIIYNVYGFVYFYLIKRRLVFLFSVTAAQRPAFVGMA